MTSLAYCTYWLSLESAEVVQVFAWLGECEVSGFVSTVHGPLAFEPNSGRENWSPKTIESAVAAARLLERVPRHAVSRLAARQRQIFASLVSPEEDVPIAERQCDLGAKQAN